MGHAAAKRKLWRRRCAAWCRRYLSIQAKEVPKNPVVSKSIKKAFRKSIAMVGDRKFDIEGAKAFGLTGIGVAFGYAQEGELEQAGADYIVETVAELERLLMK